jgi:methylase of polypeptide subunit release factors
VTQQDSPLHLLPPTEFAALREAFITAHFTASDVCRRLGISAMHEYTPRREGREEATTIESPLDVWIRLFIDVEPVELTTVSSAFGTQTVDRLRAAGLIAAAHNAAVESTVMLYPLDELWLVSDVASSMRPGTDDRDDIVYPAVTANTRRFLDGLPSTMQGDFLELCGGTGAAALKAARAGARAWTTDITRRSTLFAAFNAALNGIDGCAAIEGDLYAAVPDMQFDRIAAHPPYVASPTSRLIFRDGGEDGEAVTRGIVTGLPRALRPGGRCHLTCMVTDRRDAPIEHRLRTWIGPTQADYDVHLFVRTAFTPESYYAQLADDGAMSADERDEWIAYFTRLDVTTLLFSWIVIERHATRRPPITRRRIRVSDASQDDIESILTWETRFEDPSARLLTLSARPQLHPDVRLTALLRAHGGSWRPETTVLESLRPFRARVDLPSEVTGTVARMDGTRTPAELLVDGVRLGEFRDTSTVDDVLDLIRQLLGSGMVRISSDS